MKCLQVSVAPSMLTYTRTPGILKASGLLMNTKDFSSVHFFRLYGYDTITSGGTTRILHGMTHNLSTIVRLFTLHL